MLLALFLLPLSYWIRPPRYVAVSTYLAGANVDAGSASFQGAMGEERTVATPNYYLTMFINERKLTQAAIIASLVIIALMLGASFVP
jgi:ech hydrogenase subunit A